jgi:hypothetical protein
MLSDLLHALSCALGWSLYGGLMLTVAVAAFAGPFCE